MREKIYRCENCDEKFAIRLVDEYPKDGNFEVPKWCPYCGKSEYLLIHSK